MAAFPIVMSTAGYVPQTPAQLNSLLIASVTAVNPGYTANLPGSLIEDISSTDTYALLMCDSSFGDLVNSVTPYGANMFLLNQLGQVYGVPYGQNTNTSVDVVFTGPPGFVIVQGFVVSDGTYQYIIQDGGIIGTSGQSDSLYALANQAGVWPVPVNTVNQIVTSLPPAVTLTVNNPVAGVPSPGGETAADYRGRVLTAGLAASQGMGRYLKTLLANVPGVQARLVSVQQQPFPGGWSVICGGGDPYAVAYAIWQAIFDVSSLSGAVLQVAGITNANPGVCSTSLNHGYTTGQVVTISLSNPAVYNGSYTITVLTPTTFSLGINTTALAPYVGSAVLSPVLRNVVKSINDFPDTYQIPYINPPQQVVAITVTWNTIATSYVNPAAISQLAIPALVAYINSIIVGQPINIIEMDVAFRNAIAAILSPPLLSRLIFAVSINGIGVSPSAGTQIIIGDPSSYFYTDTAHIVVNQG